MEMAMKFTRQELIDLSDEWFRLESETGSREGGDLTLKLDGTVEGDALAWMRRNRRCRARDIEMILLPEIAADPAGAWLLRHGVKTALAAALLGHLNPERACTPGAWWRFAGLDPTHPKGNARLKRAVLRIGSDLASGSDGHYAQKYLGFLTDEIERDANGRHIKVASDLLRQGNKEPCYASGRLTETHLQRRAMRLLIKTFLAHLCVFVQKQRGMPPEWGEIYDVPLEQYAPQDLMEESRGRSEGA